VVVFAIGPVLATWLAKQKPREIPQGTILAQGGVR